MGGAEVLVHSYQKSFKLPVIIVRSNNVYGPHQYPEKIIPKFSLLLHRRQPVVLHGDGTPTRRYLFAGDAADAFDTILHKGQMDQIYNVGSYDEISNLTLCSKLLTYLDIPHSTQEELHKWVKHTVDRPFNDHRYAVDGTKLRQLGWEQKTSFSTEATSTEAAGEETPAATEETEAEPATTETEAVSEEAPAEETAAE